MDGAGAAEGVGGKRYEGTCLTDGAAAGADEEAEGADAGAGEEAELGTGADTGSDTILGGGASGAGASAGAGEKAPFDGGADAGVEEYRRPGAGAI